MTTKPRAAAAAAGTRAPRIEGEERKEEDHHPSRRHAVVPLILQGEGAAVAAAANDDDNDDDSWNKEMDDRWDDRPLLGYCHEDYGAAAAAAAAAKERFLPYYFAIVFAVVFGLFLFLESFVGLCGGRMIASDVTGDNDPKTTTTAAAAVTFQSATANVAQNMHIENRSSKDSLIPKSMCSEIREFQKCHSFRNSSSSSSTTKTTRHGQQQQQQPPEQLLLFNLTFPDGCADLFERNLGTGALTLGLLETRFNAFAAGDTALIYDCGYDAYQTRHDLVLPWMSGYFPPAPATDRSSSLSSDNNSDDNGDNQNDNDNNHIQDTGGAAAAPFNMIMPPEDYCPLLQQPDGDNNHCAHRKLRVPPGTNTVSNNNNHQRQLHVSMPLRYMIPFLRYDLRRMAVALVGTGTGQQQQQTAAATLLWPPLQTAIDDFEKTYLRAEAARPRYAPSPATGGAIHRIPIHEYYTAGPVFPNIELDDVVIHFRCGDVLLGLSNFDRYYVKYSEYTKIISPQARSIGIVTQPFSVDEGDGVQVRSIDHVDQSGDRCRVLVLGLVDYLREHVPAADRITVHNGPNETIALAWARLIMANQTLALSRSTFSVFPAVASFGTGYLPAVFRMKNGKDASNAAWLHHEMAPNLYDDEHLVFVHSEQVLGDYELNQTWTEQGAGPVLEWFQT